MAANESTNSFPQRRQGWPESLARIFHHRFLAYTARPDHSPVGHVRYVRHILRRLWSGSVIKPASQIYLWRRAGVCVSRDRQLWRWRKICCPVIVSSWPEARFGRRQMRRPLLYGKSPRGTYRSCRGARMR